MRRPSSPTLKEFTNCCARGCARIIRSSLPCAPRSKARRITWPRFALKLRARRDLTVDACRAIPHMSCVAPRGAFYAFPKIDIPDSDEQFVKKLLVEKHVLIVHGTGFGQAPGTKHLRIVFLPDEATLTRAYEGLRDFITEHYA